MIKKLENCLVLTLMFLLFSIENKSQINPSPNYVIVNKLGCPVKIDYRVFDPASSCVIQCFQAGVVIAAGNAFTVSCAGTGFDILIDVIEIDGNLLTPSVGTLLYGSGPSGTGPWSCYNGGTPGPQMLTGPIAAGSTSCNGSSAFNIQLFAGNATIW